MRAVTVSDRHIDFWGRGKDRYCPVEDHPCQWINKQGIEKYWQSQEKKLKGNHKEVLFDYLGFGSRLLVGVFDMGPKQVI